jgi:hypothetical protein
VLEPLRVGVDLVDDEHLAPVRREDRCVDLQQVVVAEPLLDRVLAARELVDVADRHAAVDDLAEVAVHVEAPSDAGLGPIRPREHAVRSPDLHRHE